MGIAKRTGDRLTGFRNGINTSLHVCRATPTGLKRINPHDLIFGQAKRQRFFCVAPLEFTLWYALRRKPKILSRIGIIDIKSRQAFPLAYCFRRPVLVTKFDPARSKSTRQRRPIKSGWQLSDIIRITERSASAALRPSPAPLAFNLIPVGIHRSVKKHLRSVPSLKTGPLRSTKRPRESIGRPASNGRFTCSKNQKHCEKSHIGTGLQRLQKQSAQMREPRL